MDIISHGLWGGAALGRNNRKNYMIAFVFSLLPDVFAEGIMFLFLFLGFENMPSWENGHPDITEFPVYAQNFYNTTHSLVVFAGIFLIVWIIRKKPYLLILTWGIHILIDIPTHSFDLFPTPFLWPLSDFKVNGIGWRDPVIMIPNILLLIGIYTFWYYKQKRQNIHG